MDPDRVPGVAAARPLVLCIVDRSGWAHDRKTQALTAALAGQRATAMPPA